MKRFPKKRFSFALLIFVLSLSAVIAQGSAIPERIEIDEKPGQKVPLDATFSDETGMRVTLKDLIKRPVILSFVYPSCTHRCLLLLGGIADVIGKIKMDPLKDYSVITVSFDDMDSPEVARTKKRTILKQSESLSLKTHGGFSPVIGKTSRSLLMR